MKFIAIWAMVITADYMLEFRFEFLWPFWLLLRSVYDSFKYQGLVNIDILCNNNIIIKLKEIMQKHIILYLSGLLCIFYLYRAHFRHDLLLFHPCALAVLCCQHLRLGAICLAHRYVEKYRYL